MTTVEFDVPGKLPAMGGELPGEEKSSITKDTSEDISFVGYLFMALLMTDAVLGEIALVIWIARQF